MKINAWDFAPVINAVMILIITFKYDLFTNLPLLIAIVIGSCVLGASLEVKYRKD